MLRFCLDLACLILCMLLLLLWVHIRNCSVVYGKHCLLVVTYHLWLSQSYHTSSSMIPESQEEGFYLEILFRGGHSLLFFVSWPVVGLCVNHHLLKLLWLGLRSAQIHEYLSKALRIHLALWPFSKIIDNSSQLYSNDYNLSNVTGRWSQ